jgi:CubicO group peptidase (beta-lactamase class C family)
MLLDHTSGLPAFAPLYKDAETREQAIEHLWEVSLRRTPGRSPDYSDLNAILLGLIVERIAGVPLDQLARQEVFDPLGMHQTLFAPGANLRPTIAPSMSDDQGPLAGRPSDPNAFALGGVAGHAGVFGTGRVLARFAQAWLREGQLADGRQWVSALTLRQFLVLSSPTSTRMLGWDTPARNPFLRTTTSFGSMPSPTTYGHTGWSGTSLWLDPTNDLFMILLTNRSFDPQVRQSLGAIRDARHHISDAARRSAGARCAGAGSVRC